MTFETLRHHWELRQQLEKHENLLCELRHSAQATSHAPDGMPRTKGVSDKVGTLAIVIVDLEERIAYLKKTIAAEEGDISAWISGIEDPLVRPDLPSTLSLWSVMGRCSADSRRAK